MAHTLKVTLTDAQRDILQERAENREGDPEDTAALAEDLVNVRHGRVKALMKYARKLSKEDATSRPYPPLRFEDEQRQKIKAAAIAEGIAPSPRRNGAHPK